MSGSINSGKTVNKRGQVRLIKYKSKYSRKLPDVNTTQTCQIGEETVSDGLERNTSTSSNLSFLGNNSTQDTLCASEANKSDELQNTAEIHETENIQVRVDFESINNHDYENQQWDKNMLIEDLISELRFGHDGQDGFIHVSGLENDILEDISEDSSEDLDNVNEEPVQPGHTMATTTSVLLIWMFIITHSLTASQVSDLLALINLHLLVPNSALKSLHHFKKYFSQMKSPVTKHFFCHYCFKGVKQDTKVCPNILCGKDISTKKGKEFFIELNTEKQIENLLAKEEFRKNLTHRLTRVKKHKNNFEDVYDGLLYKSLSGEGGILNKSNVNNISFTVNTDDVPIFKSSKTSIWPIFLMINELPYRLRKQRENMLLCGLWFGQEKPMMNMFFDPLVKSLEKLKTGINVQIGGENLLVKGILLCLSCDIPARSAVLNMNQHNGESSCPKCLQTGVNTRTTAGGNIRTFPFNANNPTGPERTCSQVTDNGILANQKHQTVNGIKGISFLMFTPHFDMVKSVGLDYMHMLCLGIIRLLTRLWFSAEHGFPRFFNSWVY